MISTMQKFHMFSLIAGSLTCIDCVKPSKPAPIITASTKTKPVKQEKKCPMTMIALG